MEKYIKLYDILSELKSYEQKYSMAKSILKDITKESEHKPVVTMHLHYCDDSKRSLTFSSETAKLLELEVEFLDKKIKELKSEAKSLASDL